MPNQLHGMHQRTFLEGHGPPPPWPPRLYRFDKAGEPLPRGSGSTRPPPEVSTPGWAPVAQAAPGDAQ